MLRTIPLLLLIFLLHFLPGACQTKSALFGFENAGSGSSFAPWFTTKFGTLKYRVETDSVTLYSGKKSVRFSRDTSAAANSEGGLHLVVPIDVISKTITVSAWFKQAVPDDSCLNFSVIVSEDKGETRTIVKGIRISGAGEWKQFRITVNTVEYKGPPDHIRINILDKDDHTCWMDDVQVEADGKDLWSIPSMASARGEISKELNPRQFQNLFRFAQIWGFLKYFHPRVAAGAFNWDMELFRVYDSVKNCADSAAFNRFMISWIQHLGEIPSCNPCKISIPKKKFNDNLDIRWMQAPEFSDSLQNLLAAILENRHTGDGFYAKYQPVKNLLFTNENEYNWRGILFPREIFRMQFLFRYWNTIQYFYPYKYLIGKDWGQVLYDMLPRFASVSDTTQYHLLQSELVNSVEDSHAGFYDEYVHRYFAKYQMPFYVTFAGDSAVIARFTNDSTARPSGLQKGDVVLSVDGRPLAEIIRERSPYVSGSNPAVKRISMSWNGFLLGGADSLARLDVLRDNQRISLTVKRYQTVKYDRLPQTEPWKILAGNIGYINMGTLTLKQMDSLVRDLNNTKALIIDLRNYPNSTVGAMSEWLYSKKMQFAGLTFPNLDFPGTFTWKDPVIKYGDHEVLKSRVTYEGKICILVNELTQSQAEWTAMALQVVPGAVTIGSQTSGADGNVSDIFLHGRHTYMTGLGIYYPDGICTQRAGVRIDIPVIPTVAGLKAGRDEVLEKALTLLKE